MLNNIILELLKDLKQVLNIQNLQLSEIQNNIVKLYIKKYFKTYRQNFLSPPLHDISIIKDNFIKNVNYISNNKKNIDPKILKFFNNISIFKNPQIFPKISINKIIN